MASSQHLDKFVASTLSEEVKGDILRAVPVHKVMAKMGAVFACSAATTVEAQKEEHGLSEPVEKIDDFISHDWATGRWAKLLTLTYLYNGTAAVLIALLFCLALAPLVAIGALPMPTSKDYLKVCGQTIGGLNKPFFFLPLGILLFWLILIFGREHQSYWKALTHPRLIARCRRRNAFVDKVCINQVDNELKRKGILALAGYLKKCDRMVMLWSPRYLTRLWCVYEVAAWLRIVGVGNGAQFENRVAFHPVSRTLFIFLVQFTWVIQECLIVFVHTLGVDSLILPLVIGFLALLCTAKVVRNLVGHMLVLPKQLDSFSCREAQCFCCTHDHKMPGDGPTAGATLPCDRLLIYRTLEMWFRANVGQEMSAEEMREEVLNYFDSLVRVQVKRFMVERRGLIHINYMDALFACLPGILVEIDRVSAVAQLTRDQLPAELLLYTLAFSATKAFFLMPIGLKVVVHGVVYFIEHSTRLEEVLHDHAMTLFVAIVHWLLLATVTLPYLFARNVNVPILFWSVVGVYGLVAAIIYRPNWHKITKDEESVMKSDALKIGRTRSNLAELESGNRRVASHVCRRASDTE